MMRFVGRRMLWLAVTLLVASFAIFGALYLAPGDPATLLAGSHATPALIAQIHREYHLNEPLLPRYWQWLTGVLGGHLGQSFTYREPVASLLASRVGNTLILVGYASVLIIVAGIGLGLVSALARRTGIAITIGTSIGYGVPSFAAAIVLITVFAVNLGWFPVFGAGSGVADRLWHLTLPAAALAFSWIAFVAQLSRASVREEMSREHVDTARVRGIPPWLVVRKHVLRNAMIPITTVAGLTVAGLVAGDVVAEQAFGISGLGGLLEQSSAQKDFAVVQAISLVLVTVFVTVNAIVDIVNAALDPRVRLTGAGR